MDSPWGRKELDTTEQISLSQETKWMLYNLLQVGSLHQWFGDSYWILSNLKKWNEVEYNMKVQFALAGLPLT